MYAKFKTNSYVLIQNFLKIKAVIRTFNPREEKLVVPEPKLKIPVNCMFYFSQF